MAKAKAEVLEANLVTFISDIKFLFLHESGIQFKDGVYKTSDEKEIALLKCMPNVKEE